MSVVLVGHCTPDAFMLKSMVERTLPESPVHVANDDTALSDHDEEGVVWLVNRVLDGAFAVGSSGLDLIESRLKALPGARVVLISDLEEHQQTAEQLGARAGFGKKGLYDAQSADRLREAATS
ncbi:MAG: hypothetical protein MK116_00850 [Phycisphaerales bacterium]|nr:hypothetical protein [Phycisphaerales bacterium]